MEIHCRMAIFGKEGIAVIIHRIACGASNCIHNHKFKCKLRQIEVDETSKCLYFKERD
ncbi:MAG: DUF1540 domain-containing protein [Methanosarcinaceae archaeon]